ncbi:HDOD domain-containing protein [Jatrophihabitans sp. DSM 45814]
MVAPTRPRPDDRTKAEVPSRAAAATRVLLMIDDPDSGVAELANAIGCDPAFTARVMALANSAYYGLGGRVGSVQFAVSVLGFQTIRALAVSAAAGLDRPDSVPVGFWEQAAVSATAASAVAPILGANSQSTFCLGLLHTLGSALLHQRSPLPQLCLPFAADSDELQRRELELYGVGHAEAGAELLSSWRFPQQLCELIHSHHEVPLPDANALSRSLSASREITDLALNEHADRARSEHVLLRLSEGRLTPSQLDPLLSKVIETSASLLSGLTAS